MKITICGSMSFAREMIDFKKQLELKGFEVATPEKVEDYLSKELQNKVSDGSLEGAQRKIDNDFIKKHYREIEKADTVLIINKDKNGIKNYIGGNSFLEIGFAYVLNKEIYLLNEIPNEQKIFYQEIVAMQPIVLNGDINKINL